MKESFNFLFPLFMGFLLGIASYGTFQSHTYEMPVGNPEPKTEYIYIEPEDPEVVYDTKVVYVEKQPEFYRNIPAADEWYYKDIAMREGEGEGVNGMLWIMYTFENRCETFNMTPAEMWASSAFETSMFRTGITPNEDCQKAYEIFAEGWEPKPLYFRTNEYHSFAQDLCQVGNHYFSM